MKVAVQPSFQSFPTEINDPDWRWGRVCPALDVGVSKGLGTTLIYV